MPPPTIGQGGGGTRQPPVRVRMCRRSEANRATKVAASIGRNRGARRDTGLEARRDPVARRERRAERAVEVPDRDAVLAPDREDHVVVPRDRLALDTRRALTPHRDGASGVRDQHDLGARAREARVLREPPHVLLAPERRVAETVTHGSGWRAAR
jgi:hypothetical protein